MEEKLSAVSFYLIANPYILDRCYFGTDEDFNLWWFQNT